MIQEILAEPLRLIEAHIFIEGLVDRKLAAKVRTLHVLSIPDIIFGGIASCAVGYSFRDTGSDSFFGDFLSNRKISSRPEAGTPTLPSRTISLALRLRP